MITGATILRISLTRKSVHGKVFIARPRPRSGPRRPSPEERRHGSRAVGIRSLLPLEIGLDAGGFLEERVQKPVGSKEVALILGSQAGVTRLHAEHPVPRSPRDFCVGGSDGLFGELEEPCGGKASACRASGTAVDHLDIRRLLPSVRIVSGGFRSSPRCLALWQAVGRDTGSSRGGMAYQSFFGC